MNNPDLNKAARLRRNLGGTIRLWLRFLAEGELRSQSTQHIAQALAMAKPGKFAGRQSSPAALQKLECMLHQWKVDVNAIADELAFDDPGFDRADFLAECDYHE